MKNLQSSLAPISSISCPDSALKHYNETLQSALDEAAPPIHKTTRHRRQQPWHTLQTRFLQRCSRCAERLWRKSNLPEDFIHYKFMLKTYNSALHLSKQTYFNTLITSLSNNPKRLFDTFQSLLNPRAQAPTTDLRADNLANYFKEKIDHIRQEIISQSLHTMHCPPSPTASSSLSDFEPVTEEELKAQTGSRSCAQLKNLLCCVDGDLLVWNQEDCAFHSIRLRSLSGDSVCEQQLLCINPPLFNVTEVLLNPTQQHIALIGSKGLMVLDVPKRWGKNSEFEGGQKTVNCRTIPIAERIFTSSTSLVLKRAAWYPSETQNPHLILLTSDNTISDKERGIFGYHCKIFLGAFIGGHGTLPNCLYHYCAFVVGSVHMLSFGCFSYCFNTECQLPSDSSIHPWLPVSPNEGSKKEILRNSNVGRLLGPLLMHPAAEDNYGFDACSVLCLSCVPNILVIATESGLLYHCVVLEGEEDDEQTEPCVDSDDYVGMPSRSLKAHATVANLPRCGRKREIDKRFQRKIVQMLDKEPSINIQTSSSCPAVRRYNSVNPYYPSASE
ncbi:unnamed protein product [Ranitomeya imitator]|uniref:Uncharacterized protein n=1 Tax=Ranitomeya imitator TaxID=111125 RepID=A0ABN9LZM4_9NEOB|nr:unnamed protein product [Ranitomeya imitator]